MQLDCSTKEAQVQFLNHLAHLLKTVFAHSGCPHRHLLLTLTGLVLQQVLSCLCHPFCPLLPGEKGQRTIGYFYVSNAFLWSGSKVQSDICRLPISKTYLEPEDWPFICSALHPGRKSDSSCLWFGEPVISAPFTGTMALTLLRCQLIPLRMHRHPRANTNKLPPTLAPIFT